MRENVILQRNSPQPVRLTNTQAETALTKSFNFEDGGRTYTCAVEKSRTVKNEAWWWFNVSGDGQRYAPFHAVTGDTQETVKSRIVTYYNDRLTARSQPFAGRGHWAQRGRPPAAQKAATEAVAD